MPDEKIAIEIVDKVASGISDKILKIAEAADKAYLAVLKLKNELNSLNTSAFSKLSSAVDKNATALLRNQILQQRLATAQQQTATATQRLAATQAQSAAATDRAALAHLRLEQAQQRVAKATSTASNFTGGLIRNLLAIAGVSVSANAILGLADAYTNLQNKLRPISESEGQLNELTERTFQIANKTRTAVDETGKAIQRFDNSLKGLGKSQEDTLRLTETVNKLFKVGGTATQEQAGALLQLSQAFNSNTLAGEEFRSVSENMPKQVRTAIAEVLKINEGGLKKAASEGKITGDVLYKAFKKLEEFADSKFAALVPTLGESMQVLRNSATKFFGEINRSLGVTESISKLILSLSNNLKTLALGATIAGAALAVYFGPALLGLIATATKAMWGFTLALAANPVGILLIALAGAATAVILFKDELKLADDEAVAWFEDLSELVDLIGNYFKPILEDVLKTLGIMSDEVNSTSTGFNILKSALSFAIEVLQVIAVIASDVVFVFKMVGSEIGGIAAQLVALAKLDFTGFSAISEAIKEDAVLARKELDQFQSRVMSFGKQENITAKANAPQEFTRSVVTPVSSLRGAGKPLPTTNNNAVKEAESRAGALAKINAELDKEIKGFGLLQPQREIQSKMDQIEINLAQKKIKLTETEHNSIQNKIKAIEENKAVQSAFDAIYESSIATSRDYNAQMTAANKLLAIGAISQEDYSRAVVKAIESNNASTDPLYEINKQLSEQADLLSKIGIEQEVSAQVQQISNNLLQKGVVLSAEENKTLTNKLLLQQQQQAINQQLNALYAESQGAVQDLNNKQLALNQAVANGLINQTAYEQKTVQMGIAMANLKLQMQDGTFGDVFISSLGTIVSQYQGVLSGISNSFGSFFTDLTDGFANSIGRAVVYAEDLSTAMDNVAKEAVAGLISSLVKLGIQYAVNAALGTSLGAAALATQTTESVAAAGITSAAWATPAALVSLATMGANSVPAMAGIEATTLLSESLAFAGMAGFKQGGFTGNVGTSEIAGVVHGKEFVMNAEATARNRPMLEAMNRGASAVAANSSTGSSGAIGANFKINVENNGTPQSYSVESITADEVRLIATDIAKSTVRNETPSIVAGQIKSPNSVISKSIANSTQTQRRRGG